MKRRSLFQMLVGLFVAPKLPATASTANLDRWRKCLVPEGFVSCPDYRTPRWNFIAGQWVKAEPSHPQDTNTDYVTVPYEDRGEGLKINS